MPGSGQIRRNDRRRCQLRAKTNLSASTPITVGFQYVEQRSTKKTRKRRNNPRNKWTPDQASQPLPDLAQNLEARRCAMQKFDWLNLSSTWFSECLELLDLSSLPRRVVCLALGSFSPVDESNSTHTPGVASCAASHGLKQSQYQLVFLLDVILAILSTRLSSQESDSIHNHQCQTGSEIDPSISQVPLTISFYDPAFNQKDKEDLRQLGHIVLDEEPSLFCEEPTLFYMPHAPKTLYERLLAENSSAKSLGTLNHVILIGNDLKNYQKIMVQEEKNSIPLLMQIAHDIIHTHYPPSLTKFNQDTGVYFFNETCLQWFKPVQPLG